MAFSSRFGSLGINSRRRLPGTRPPRDHDPVEHEGRAGRSVGARDAGQDWHTDMSSGYAIRINELPERESGEMLSFLFDHQLQAQYRYVYRWTEGDVLLWDDIGTLHNAHADYGPDEHRLIKRCQVMADRIFDPDFVRAALA
jgi:alpha-ketoglutarate-dependent taurine dioxygenase